MQVIHMILRSYSQVFFQESLVLGALMVVGLAVASPLALALSFLGVCSSIATAVVLHVPQNVIASGAYGLNAALVGVIASVYIKHLPTAVLLAIVGSVITTLIFYAFSKNHSMALSFPFALVGWAILIIANHLK